MDGTPQNAYGTPSGTRWTGLSVRALQRKRQAESNHPAEIARRQAAKAKAKAKLLAETAEQREARLARYRKAYEARKRAKTEASALVVQQCEQDDAVDASSGRVNSSEAEAAMRRARRQADPAVRRREAEAKRKRRQENLEEVRALDAAFIGATRNSQHTCINCLLSDGTLRRRPRRCYGKCIGKDEILPEHANHSSQTEQHITLVWCPRPNVSTRNAEVQMDLV
ncbi:uncharacterized protein LOC119180035 isoform X1 [Rhipicephalus microplus]|uniref:uncharacterized protein LOC119180035 isoform X1 n=1 Tax=Rhipicephalus microplus TaxID=6941 RepID=UPI003F6B2A94